MILPGYCHRYNNSFILLQAIKDLPAAQEVTDTSGEVDVVPQQ